MLSLLAIIITYKIISEMISDWLYIKIKLILILYTGVHELGGYW